LKIALIAVLGLFVLFVGAWLLDSARTSNQVVRNTTLAGTQVGGMGSDELELVIDGLDQALTTAPLTVSVDGTVIETNPAAIGGEVDREAVIDEALSVGRGGSIFGRPIAWVTSFTSERTVEAVYRVDPNRAAEGVAGVVGEALDDPVEPSLELQGSELVLSPGSEGVTVDPAEVAQVLPPALSESNPYAITLTAVATVPTLTDESVQLVVDEASAATQAPAIFQVLDQTAQVESADMRAWVALDTTGQEPTWAINSALAIDGLRPRYPVLGSDEQQARFEVVDGEPVIFPATETVICCDPASVEGIRDALLEPASPAEDGDDEGEEAIRTIVLEPEVVSPDEGVAELETLGIIEEVSTFTTNHACCQNRVTNIQRFADLMRGVIIRPGEDFSLNGHVGRRTTENGFVADGAIANGILEPQVGGGISQFATTFFNASFFAGLDFNEYQSHSLYISRYPRGREATISFPKPDLSVNNATDYGILVWTSYTDTSITVTFYSTKHIDVVAGDLLRSDQGACSRYTTPRIRTYPDGTVAEDSVFAVYRPGEGLDCNGNSTRPEDQPNGPTAPDPQPDTTGPDVTTPEPPPTTEPAGADDDG
jgi:vancomycin resistance protein YoaR